MAASFWVVFQSPVSLAARAGAWNKAVVGFLGVPWSQLYHAS